VIYDAGVRRVVSVCLSALASLFVIGVAPAAAQSEPTTTTSPAVTLPENPTTTSTEKPTTTTTAKPAGTTTTARRGAVPPPAAGPTQTLVPDLLGTPVELGTTTTSTTQSPFSPFTTGTLPTNITTPISANSDSPSGLTLVLAAVAWLASAGGLLVYAEEKRSARWKHLAR
jgi:hypothetical protein